jgi:uridine kinase
MNDPGPNASGTSRPRKTTDSGYPEAGVGKEEGQPAGGLAFVLGIVGDSGSGKNTVADAVGTLLGGDHVTDVRLDDYHRFTREERAERGLTPLNPLVHDLSLMEEHLQLLRQGKPIRTRSYSHADGTFGPLRTIVPRDIVLARGLLGFPTPKLQSLYDLAVFLQPEPDLLFRWKLRRDVLYRGYEEAEVLKSIANHLLDAKEYVLPQAERAHLLVHYGLPDWEAPDTQLSTTIRFRREAADRARSKGGLSELPVDQAIEGNEVVVRIPAGLPLNDVDAWARSRFPGTCDAARPGAFFAESGAVQRSAPLALVELVIAYFGREMSAGAKSGR